MSTTNSLENVHPTYSSPPLTIVLVIILLVFLFIGLFFVFFCRYFMQNLIYSWHMIRRSPSGTPVGPGLSSNLPGLDPSIIESFPTFTYSSVKDYRKEKYGLECAICLVEFEDSSMLRLLRTCNHVFHEECVDLWLESHKTCPVCRSSLDSQEILQRMSPSSFNDAMHDINVDVSLEHACCIAINDKDEDEEEEEEHEDKFDSRRIEQMAPKRIENGELQEKFPRSHSTGHSIIRAREADQDKFTLILPEHVMAKIIMGHHTTKSCTTFGEFNSKKTIGNGGFGEVSESHTVDINKK